MTHRCQLTVRFNEVDGYNHVNHGSYVTYFEVARTEALDACGIPIGEVSDKGLQLVVTRLDVRYRRSAGVGDRLTVETELGELRRASGIWRQRVLRGEELLASAEITIAVTDRDGRPTRPPDWLIEGFRRL